MYTSNPKTKLAEYLHPQGVQDGIRETHRLCQPGAHSSYLWVWHLYCFLHWLRDFVVTWSRGRWACPAVPRLQSKARAPSLSFHACGSTTEFWLSHWVRGAPSVSALERVCVGYRKCVSRRRCREYFSIFQRPWVYKHTVQRTTKAQCYLQDRYVMNFVSELNQGEKNFGRTSV